MVIFRLEISYKNTKKYYDGMKILINEYQKYFPNFYLRIYYDSSVTDNYEEKHKNYTLQLWQPLFREMKKNKYIQLVKYDIPKWRKNKTYHEGLIGTMVRFFPLFDIPENKNIQDVLIFDIDINIMELEFNKKYYDILNKNANIQVLYRIYGCYYIGYRFNSMKEYFDTQYAIIADAFFSKIKFPVSLFNDFIKCVDNNCSYFLNFINYFKKYPSRNIPKTNTLGNTKFIYGIDELFLLSIKKYIQDNNIPHIIIILREIINLIRLLKTNYEDKIIDKEIFEKQVKFLLGNKYDNNKNIMANYDKLYDMSYTRFGEINEDNMFIIKNIERMFKKLKKVNKEKKYGYPKEAINCILEQNFTKYETKLYF